MCSSKPFFWPALVKHTEQKMPILRRANLVVAPTATGPVVQYDKGWYALKIALAAIIAAFSLAENSKEGVIGTMLISPLGTPVVAVVTSVMALSITGFVLNMFVLVASSCFLVACGYGVGQLYKYKEPTLEMMQRYSDVSVKNVVIAFFIGIVMAMGALSIGKGNGFGASELVGAGIAISLLPPLVNAGLTYVNMRVSSEEKAKCVTNSLKLSMYNMVGLALGSVVAFLVWQHSAQRG